VELVNGHQVLAHVCGKLRKKFMALAVGDRVKMEMVPYDLQKACIVGQVRDQRPRVSGQPSSTQNRR
jgi:translation initiation factor IF-1